MAIPTGALQAARKYGSLVDQLAQQYSNPVTGGRLSGTALLLKLSKGENAYRMGGAPSSAGARGATQFTPGSRQEAISKFGIDPWHSYDEAFHAAAEHLLGKINGQTGLRGYNPGMASYTDYILGQRVGKISGGSSTSAAPSRSLGASTSSTVSSPAVNLPDSSPSTGIADLLATLQQRQRPQIAIAGLASPSFSSDRYLSSGGAVPTSGGGIQPPQRDYASLIAQLTPAATSAPPTTTSSSSATPAVAPATRTVAAAHNGQVIISPGANRAGVPLTNGILKIVRELSAYTHHPITVGTGTNHNQMTTSGNVSDHWEGNAADIPKSGAALTRLGQQALQAFGMSAAQAQKATGGVYNLAYGKHRRIQILFNTNIGGNHFNHLHIGVTALGGNAR